MMRLLMIFVLCLAGHQGLAAAQEQPEEVVLWPQGVPEPVVAAEPAEELQTGKDGMTRRFNVSRPRLFVHRPSATPSTGAAVIVVPGGGFARLADEHEGRNVCTFLAGHGITAFQLAYRTPTNTMSRPVSGPAQDVQKAVAEVRRLAADWRLDAHRIGVMGFSAGGQAALVAAGSSVLIDGADAADVRPDALLLIYPYQVLDSAQPVVRQDVAITERFPPVFLAQSADDRTSPAEGVVTLFTELRSRQVPVELHIYETGGHGFGLRPTNTAPGMRDWSFRAADWLRLRGFLNVQN